MNDDNMSCIAEVQVRPIKLSKIMEGLTPSERDLLCLVVDGNFIPAWFKRDDANRKLRGGAMILITFTQLCWALVNCYHEHANADVLGALLGTLREIRTNNGAHHTLRIDVLN